jgi:hypothetical protein
MVGLLLLAFSDMAGTTFLDEGFSFNEPSFYTRGDPDSPQQKQCHRRSPHV